MQQVLGSQSLATSGDENMENLPQPQSPPGSSVHYYPPTANKAEVERDFVKCICKKYKEAIRKKELINPEGLQEELHNREDELRSEYDKILEREKSYLKERFDFILQNEQIRTCHMLRETNREKDEKIHALKSQLQCKNLAALMYVMCTERKRSKLEKLRVIRDYTNYINLLHEILTDAQELILHLSRGYKTAARVDHEWREKMTLVVKEFLAFIYHYAGGSPESNQYFLDLPELLKIEAPLVDNPQEDPCESEEVEESPPPEIPTEKEWFEQLDEDDRPFVMFGDLSDFKPEVRREVLRKVKAPKTAPKKWKNYVFNEMFLKSGCNHTSKIKDMYPKLTLSESDWDATSFQQEDAHKLNSKHSFSSGRRLTGQSIDVRGTMGSIIKIITSNVSAPKVPAKTELLGARDSMEIASTTKLRNSLKPTDVQPDKYRRHHEPKEVVLNIGRKRASVFEDLNLTKDEEEEQFERGSSESYSDEDIDDVKEATSLLGNLHHDSLEVITSHVPDRDHHIKYEKACPLEACRQMQEDVFMNSLPPYMRANPYLHFEQTYENYEICTPEQLEMLKQRLEAKKQKDAEQSPISESPPLEEWSHRGVAVQTSITDLNLPPCTCQCFKSAETPTSSTMVFKVEDLLPVKRAMDAIHRECFFDSKIDFNRFKLIGQNGSNNDMEVKEKEKVFKQARYDEIHKILKKHPSLLDIFQANT